MIRSVVLCAAALAAFAVATGARAADEGVNSDVRCLAVAAAMAQGSDPKAKSAGLMAGLYYLGKLDGHDPNFDLEGRVKQEMAQMKPEEIITEAQRCGAQLTARGKTITEIGARLQSQGASKAP